MFCSAMMQKPKICSFVFGSHHNALLVLPVDTCLAITWPKGVWCFSKCDSQSCCSSLIVWGSFLLHIWSEYIPLTNIHSLVLAASFSRWAGFPLNLHLYYSSIFLLSYLGLHNSSSNGLEVLKSQFEAELGWFHVYLKCSAQYAYCPSLLSSIFPFLSLFWLLFLLILALPHR